MNARRRMNQLLNNTDCGYGPKVLCCYDDEYRKPVQKCRGENAVSKIMENMSKWYQQRIKKNHNKLLIMTDDNKGNFHEAGECHIRNKDIIVRDHCHVTGKYGGSAHSSHFYLTFKLTDKILVILHNLRGYDSHFIMQQIAKLNQDIKVLPN